MIYIPLGKALVPVEVKKAVCTQCVLHKTKQIWDCFKRCLWYRKDGKNVIFLLVDWPGEEEKNNA